MSRYVLVAHDLFGKPLHTFPDHALARAAEPAGGVAGHGVALHAGPADVNTLIDLLGVIARVMLGDAGALFGSVIHLLRTGRQTSSEDRQANQTSQWHVARSRLGVPEPVAPGSGVWSVFDIRYPVARNA